MFIAALFTIAKTWKQSKCPLTDDWIRKMWYTYTIEQYSAIKKNKIMPFAATWWEPEILILSEVSQKEKDKYHIISLISGIQYMPQMYLSTEKKQVCWRAVFWLTREREEWEGLRFWGQQIQTIAFEVDEQ